MNLLNKTSRYYALVALPVFLAGAVILFFIMKYLLDGEATEQLYVEKQKVLDYFASAETLPDISLKIGDEIFITPTAGPVGEQLRDTMIYTASEEDRMPYRQLIFPVVLKNIPYAVRIRTTLYENDELLTVILLSIIGLMVMLFVLLFMLNRQLSRKLWQPFNDTLQRLNSFQLAGNRALTLTSSNVDEFKSLNETLIGISSKMQRDYQLMKEFSENASHELQTPLAIIQSKIELLMQSEQMNEDDLHHLQEVNESIQRLSKINRALLMLSKIGNRQFHNLGIIRIDKIIEEKVSQWRDIILHHALSVETNLKETTEWEMDVYLADVLISNLLSNAIKHNEGGKIRIETEEKSFTISNTGQPPATDPQRFFERFKKDKNTDDSPGLGLAIVKEICDVYHFSILYLYEDGWHSITVSRTWR